jgi:hypothetical protein
MLDSLVKVRNFAIAVFFILASFAIQAKTLDDFIDVIQKNPQYDPFVVGEAEALRHPLNSELMEFAQKYNTTVIWTTSVAKEVLKLPFHPDRMVIKKNEALDGWFDDLVSPNSIILHQEAAFITLIHELRHAVQLGSHGLNSGTAFDRLLQQNKRRILKFHQRMIESDLAATHQERLKKAATRLVETASEISAHEGDVVLSKSYGHKETAASYLQFIREYKAEFLKDYKALKKDPFSQNEVFIEDLYQGLKEFMKSKKLEIKGFASVK